jgi:hypothetical protein
MATSSSIPQFLLSFEEDAQRIQGDLVKQANWLEPMLQRFARTCTEYNLGISGSDAEEVYTLASMIGGVGSLVGAVGVAYKNADTHPLFNFHMSYESLRDGTANWHELFRFYTPSEGLDKGILFSYFTLPLVEAVVRSPVHWNRWMSYRQVHHNKIPFWALFNDTWKIEGRAGAELLRLPLPQDRGKVLKYNYLDLLFRQNGRLAASAALTSVNVWKPEVPGVSRAKHRNAAAEQRAATPTARYTGLHRQTTLGLDLLKGASRTVILVDWGIKGYRNWHDTASISDNTTEHIGKTAALTTYDVAWSTAITVVGSLAGGAIGAAVGGPVGAAVGARIGQIAGGFVSPWITYEFNKTSVGKTIRDWLVDW